MKRISLRLVVASLTFGFGVFAAAFWIAHRTPPVEELGAPACCSVKFESKAPQGMPPGNFYFRAGTFLPDEVRENEFIKWYSRSLTALQEPSLYSLSDTNIEAYRFLWLRSFHPAVSIRVWRCESGYCMSVKQLDSKDEYVDGEFIPSAKLGTSYTRPLNFDEWNSLITLIEEARFWFMPTVDGESLANDGAFWILEGVKEEKHHVVDRQSPGSGVYREACVYLIKLSGLKVDEAKHELY